MPGWTPTVNFTVSVWPAAFVPEHPVPSVAVKPPVQSAGMVSGFPLASWRATVIRMVEVPSAAFGELFDTTTSLFGAPVITVVSVALALAIPDAVVLAVHWQVPGVLVAVMTKYADPLTTGFGPLPVLLTVQLLAPVTREMLTCVVLSAVLMTPFASVTSTSSTSCEEGSAEIVVRGTNVAASWVDVPGAVTVIVCEQPVVTVAELIEMIAVPATPVPAEAYLFVPTPFCAIRGLGCVAL